MNTTTLRMTVMMTVVSVAVVVLGGCSAGGSVGDEAVAGYEQRLESLMTDGEQSDMYSCFALRLLIDDVLSLDAEDVQEWEGTPIPEAERQSVYDRTLEATREAYDYYC